MDKHEQLEIKYRNKIKVCQEFVEQLQTELQKWEKEEPDWDCLAVLHSQEHDLANLVFNMGGLTKEEQEKYRI